MRQDEFFEAGEFADHPPEFEEFWKRYPRRRGRRVGRAAALRLWLKLKPKEQCEAFRAMENYARSEQVREGYVRDANRFLAGDYWRDWLDGEGNDVDEREVLIAELKGRAGKRYGASTLIARGVEGMHGGVTTWAEMSTEQLKRIREATR